MSFLFDEIIFGPVRSRRFGVSLGINVIPEHKKICTFNCIYCECGWTQAPVIEPEAFHKREDIAAALETRLKEMQRLSNRPDAITFAGNGEPTLHPEFDGIIDDTVRLRDTYFPDAEVVVLSNSSMLNDESVLLTLQKVHNVMKLDAGTEATFRKINGPLVPLTLEKVVENLERFKGKLTIQTLFLKAEINGESVDNTSDAEVSAWIELLKRINPEKVMIYPIDRPAPGKNIQKVEPEVLEAIGKRLEKEGIQVSIFQ
jgi:wyosine [tRNA(Phe)-imidazoG37] synthetase (radical SAM superfamily)